MASKRHKKVATVAPNVNLSSITTRLSSHQRKEENNKKVQQKNRTQTNEKVKLAKKQQTLQKLKKVNKCSICSKIFKGL